MTGVPRLRRTTALFVCCFAFCCVLLITASPTHSSKSASPPADSTRESLEGAAPFASAPQGVGLYGSALIRPASATASSSMLGTGPALAMDGSLSTNWSAAGNAPQWIRFDLGRTYAVSRVRLNTSQTWGSGNTTHTISGGESTDKLTLLRTLDGTTTHQQWLDASFIPAVGGVRYLQVTTTASKGRPAWYEIEIYGSSDTDPPAVSLTLPAGGAQFYAPARVGIDAAASANASRTVGKVQFYQNNVLLGEAIAPASGNTYHFDWNNVPVGNYTLTAVVTDSAGATAASAPVTVAVVSPPGNDSPVAFWRFDDVEGVTAQDSSGKGHTGALAGGPVWSAGRIGHSLAFDGVDDGVAVAGSLALSNVTNNFTIAFWADPRATHEVDAEGADLYAGVANQRYAIGPEQGASAYGSEEHAGAGVSVGTNGVSVYEHSAKYMPAQLVYPAAINGWTHVAVVYENRRPRLYVNGVLARTGLQSVKTYVHAVPAQIGGMGYGRFSGRLDDVRVYGRPLSEAEIKSLASFDETVWVEDSLPAGAVPAGDEPWTWAASNPSPYFGTAASQSASVAGVHQHYFAQATNKLTPGEGDALFAYVYLDPSDPPSEVMLQWNSDKQDWNHRAYWGANNIGWGAEGTASRRYMGGLPPAGKWVRLEVPAALVGLEGQSVNGMAFTLWGGRAAWDHAGRVLTDNEFAPAAPEGLTAAVASGTQIDLTWLDRAKDESGFKVERSTDGLSFAYIGRAGRDVTTFADTSVEAGRGYFYRVCATNDNADSGYSNVATAGLKPLSPPAAPSALSAAAGQPGRVNLKWSDNSPDESRFVVERSDNAAPGWIEVGWPGPNATAYTDTAPLASHTYTYRVRALGEAGPSAYSNTASATAAQTAQVCPAVHDTSIVQTDAGKHWIQITFDSITEFTPVGYEVYWLPFTNRGTTGVETFINPTAPQMTVIFDSRRNFPPGTFYFVRVRTWCGGDLFSQESWMEFPASTNADSCDQPRAVVTPGTTSVSILWPQVDGARDYRLRLRNLDDPNVPERVIESASSPSDLNGLTPATRYELSLQSVCGLATPFNSDEDVHRFTTGGEQATPTPTPTPPCNPPTEFVTKELTSVDTEIHFTPAQQDPVYTRFLWETFYRQADRGTDATMDFITALRGAPFFVNLDGLSPLTRYRVKLRTWCERDDGRFAIDDAFMEFTTKLCPKPDAVPDPFDPTYRKAKVSWQADDNEHYSFLVRWWIKGQQSTTGQAKVVEKGDSNTRTTLGDSTPLVPATDYEYDITTLCGERHSSQPSDAEGFRTKPCPVPTNLRATDVTLTSARLRWDEVADGYDLQYRKFSPDHPVAWTVLTNLTDGTKNVRDLVSNTTYEFQVRSHCTFAEPTAWSGSNLFTTESCAAAVPNVRVRDITKRSALIKWDAIPGVNFYQLRYRGPDGDWSPTFDIVGTEQTISGLDKCERYVVEVRSSCSPPNTPNPDFSDWNRKSFTTDGCSCDNPVTSHGRDCGELYVLEKTFDNHAGFATWNIRWATNKFKQNQWRFLWRQCSNFNNCSGDYQSITDFNSFRDKSCADGAKRHFDYYIKNFGVQADAYIEFAVQYQCDSGAWSDPVSDVIHFFTVPALTISSVSGTSANLSWDPVVGATGYVVRYGLPDQETPLEVTAGADARGINLDGLAPNTSYEAEVRAVMPDGMTAPTQQSFVTSAGGCAYTAQASSTNVEGGGGGGTVSVNTSAGCAWTATSDAWWLTVTSGASGSGNGTVGFSAVANADPEARTGVLTVAGTRITITQNGSGVPNPAPVISSLSPTSVTEGGGALALSVSGSGFTSSSLVRVNGNSRPTTFHGLGLLTASLPSSDVAQPGTLAVTVVNPPPGGGTSNTADFVVTSPTGCARRAPTVVMTPADQSGHRGQQLTYHVSITNNDSPQCSATTFDVRPTLPAAGWVHTPTSMTFTLAPGGSSGRDVLIRSAGSAPYATHTIRETATSWEGHSGSGQATYTVYSLTPPDTCGRVTPSVLITPADQRGHRGQHLTYRVTLVNNDNPQCGITTFTITPALPGAGWGQSPTSMTFSILPGETAWRDVTIWSAPNAPFASHAFAEVVTSSAEHSGSGEATYTVYDQLPPETCGRANPTVTVSPDYQTGTQAQTLNYTVIVTNNDAAACGGSSFIIRPTLPTVSSGHGWTHVPLNYFTLFAPPGESASRTIAVISASLAPMGEHTIVWTATHTSYNSGSGQAVFNVVPYGSAGFRAVPGQDNLVADFFFIYTGGLWQTESFRLTESHPFFRAQF